MVGCTTMPSGSEAPGPAVPAPMTEHFQVRQLRHPMMHMVFHPDSLASFLAPHHGAVFCSLPTDYHRHPSAHAWLVGGS